MFDTECRELLNLGRRYSLKQDYPSALKSFEQVLEGTIFDSDLILAPQFLSHYGAALAAAGNPEEGHRLCERSIQLEPYEPEHYLNLGLVRLMSGHRRKAFLAFDRGLGLHPDHPGLLAERKKLERRHFRPFPALHRDHLLNRLLGKFLATVRIRRRS